VAALLLVLAPRGGGHVPGWRRPRRAPRRRSSAGARSPAIGDVAHGVAIRHAPVARTGGLDEEAGPAWLGRGMDPFRDPVCARFVTDLGSFLIIPAHSSARGHRDLVLPQQVLTRTYTDGLRPRSENPGVGGSIPSQPTIHFKQLPPENFSQAEFVTRFVTNSGTLQRIPAHEPIFGGRLEGDLKVSAVPIPVRHSFLDR